MHDLTGRVQTVLGPVAPADLGITLTHEHVLIDLLDAHGAGPAEAGARGFYVRPLSIENIGYVRHHRWRNEDNARLSDVSAAIDEVLLYKQLGGGALVDATSIGIGRDPVGLSRVSAATGVHIVMGGAYYVESAFYSWAPGRVSLCAPYSRRFAGRVAGKMGGGARARFCSWAPGRVSYLHCKLPAGRAAGLKDGRPGGYRASCGAARKVVKRSPSAAAQVAQKRKRSCP